MSHLKRTVHLGLIQMSCSEVIEDNFAKAVDLIKEAAKQGAQIISTQELFQSLYFCQSEDLHHFDIAEEINENSPTVQRLSGLAAELEIVLIASLFEKLATGIYHNTAVVEGGSSYDHAWKTVQQGHAVANACFLAAVNRVGFEPDPSTVLPKPHGDLPGVGPKGESGILFWGQSFVADLDGKIVKQAARDEEEIVICTIDLSMIEENKKSFSFPYRDRRTDSYQDLLKLYSD